MVTRWDELQAKYGDNDYTYWQDAYAYRRLTGGTHHAAVLFATERLTPTLNTIPADFQCPWGTSEGNWRQITREEVDTWLSSQTDRPLNPTLPGGKDG